MAQPRADHVDETDLRLSTLVEVGCRPASRWRLEALDRRQQAQAQRHLTEHGGGDAHAGPPSAPTDPRELMAALSRDGRASVAELARATGVLAGVGAFERSLGNVLPGRPGLELRRSELPMRSVKRMGWLLNESGRRPGQVVVPSVSQQ